MNGRGSFCNGWSLVVHGETERSKTLAKIGFTVFLADLMIFKRKKFNKNFHKGAPHWWSAIIEFFGFFPQYSVAATLGNFQCKTQKDSDWTLDCMRFLKFCSEIRFKVSQVEFLQVFYCF
jgi:hypothetical protein